MKQLRFAIYRFDGEIWNKWIDFKPSKFNKLCRAFANNDMCFTVEFRTI